MSEKEETCANCGKFVVPTYDSRLIFPSGLNHEGKLRSATRLNESNQEFQICYPCLIDNHQLLEYKTKREWWESRHNKFSVTSRRAFEGIAKVIFYAAFLVGAGMLVWFVSHFGWAGTL